jgi:hypothetical protein
MADCLRSMNPCLPSQREARGFECTAGEYSIENPELLQQTDAQGWHPCPLHEAARFGHLDLVQYLVLDAGISLQHQLVSPLAVAQQRVPADHDVIDSLMNRALKGQGENRTICVLFFYV